MKRAQSSAYAAESRLVICTHRFSGHLIFQALDQCEATLELRCGFLDRSFWDRRSNRRPLRDFGWSNSQQLHTEAQSVAQMEESVYGCQTREASATEDILVLPGAYFVLAGITI
jgi:hypothetical protein